MSQLSAMSEEEREYSLSMAVDEELDNATEEIRDEFDAAFGTNEVTEGLWNEMSTLPAFRSLVRDRAADIVHNRMRGDDQ